MYICICMCIYVYMHIHMFFPGLGFIRLIGFRAEDLGVRKADTP